MRDPIVSIVIPTRSRPDQLRDCLGGIASLEHDPSELEVIVVNDGGQVPLEPIVAGFRDQLTLRVLQLNGAGPAVARNAGSAAARGRFLVFIDDDCVPAPEWLSALRIEHEAHPEQLLGGQVVNGLPDNPYSTASQLIASYVSEYYRKGISREMFFTTNTLALGAARFRELGGFDTSIPSRTAEDKEFCDRWRARGYPMAAVPGAIVYHAHRLTLSRFLVQHYNYGRGILAFRLLRRGQDAKPLIPERFSFYGNLILSPARDRVLRHRWRYVLLLIASQMATAAGALKASLFERHRMGRNGSPRPTG
jgi:glycosyltransferase involved in cell wall biosynthesis